MKTKLRKIFLYAAAIVVVGSIGFYASMDDYQKDNFASFVKQTFTS